mgnify:FL=1
MRVQSAVASDYLTISGYAGGIIYGSPTYQSVAIYPSAAADTLLYMSLPVASGLTGTSDLAGTAACATVTNEVIAILGGAADTAIFRWTATDLTNHALHFHFSYYIVPA